jgi:hypothetical protein
MQFNLSLDKIPQESWSLQWRARYSYSNTQNCYLVGTLFVLSGRMQKCTSQWCNSNHQQTRHTHMKHVYVVLKENHTMTCEETAILVWISAASVFSSLTKHPGKRNIHAKWTANTHTYIHTHTHTHTHRMKISVPPVQFWEILCLFSVTQCNSSHHKQFCASFTKLFGNQEQVGDCGFPVC